MQHELPLRIEGLQLSILAETKAQTDWIACKLAPMQLTDANPVTRKLTLNILSDWSMAAELQTLLAEEEVTGTPVHPRKKRVLHVATTAEIDLCVDPVQGMIWLFDHKVGRITCVTGPRTRFELSEGFSAVRAILVAHLHDQGWHTMHAGAIWADGATRLVIGNGGQGKTSLILALLAQGAGFVANERVLLKATEGGLRALPFPMPTLVGLGTALQHPRLAWVLDHPETLASEPHRFNPANLANTARENWPALPDKVPLLASDIERLVLGAPARPGGKVEGVILPRLDPESDPSATLTDPEDAEQLLRSNYMPHNREKHYPDWMPLRFKPRTMEEPGATLDQLCRQPAATVRFFDVAQADGILRQTIDCLTH